MRLGLIILGLSVTACAEFPEVDAALEAGNRDDSYPALVSFDDFLEPQEPRLNDSSDDVLLARAGALRARANALRRPVIDRATRARINQGVTRP